MHLDVVAVAVGVGEGLAAHVAPVAAVDAALGFWKRNKEENDADTMENSRMKKNIHFDKKIENLTTFGFDNFAFFNFTAHKTLAALN